MTDPETRAVCVVCSRHPQRPDSQTCPDCTAATAQLLTDLARWLPDARALLGRRLSSSTSGGGSRSASDGRPLPGGDLLALTGPGSEGLAETGETSKPNDPRSITFELTWWAGQWRQTYGDPTDVAHVDMARVLERCELGRALLQVRRDVELLRAGSRRRCAANAERTRADIAAALAKPQPSAVDKQLRQTVKYLQDRHPTAARSHPGFGAFAADLRDLHAMLARATAHHRAPRRLPADCLDCGTQLHIPIDEKTGLEKIRTIKQDGVKVQVEEPECPGCHRRYGPIDYRLARSETVRKGSTWTDETGEEWATVETVASMLTVPTRTVRSWKTRGEIRWALLGARVFVATSDAVVLERRWRERQAAREAAQEKREKAGRAG